MFFDGIHRGPQRWHPIPTKLQKQIPIVSVQYGKFLGMGVATLGVSIISIDFQQARDAGLFFVSYLDMQTAMT
jgi:hypothetical protein